MKRLLIIIGICSSLILISAASAIAEVYFVSKDGDDYNDGSEAYPWLTIQRAADAVQPGDTIYVKAGTYIEDVKITTSGEKTKRITFRPYQSDIVTVKAEVGHAFYLLGDYIIIRGFNIKGAPREIYDPNDPRCPDWTRSGITTHRSYGIFEKNEISDCMYGILIRNRDTSGELAWPSDGYNTVRNNYIHHTDFDALRVKRSNYNVVDNNRFYYNCLRLGALKNPDGTILSYLNAPLVFYALKNLKVTNNIFYEPTYGPVILEIDMTTRTPKPPSMPPNPDETKTYLTTNNIIIKNNIGYKTKNTKYPIMLTYGRGFALGKGHIIENNIWYNGTPGSKTVEWGFNFWHDNDQDDGIKPAIWTLNEFQQNTGYEENSRDTNPFE